jgi:hypothetical protein
MRLTMFVVFVDFGFIFGYTIQEIKNRLKDKICEWSALFPIIL